MQRRNFIKRVGIGLGLLTTPAIAAAQTMKQHQTVEKGQDLVAENIQKLRHQLQQAENRIDHLQASQKKAIKTTAIVTAALVGIDISLLL